LREADPDVEPADTFKLDELQANAILSLTLRTLTVRARKDFRKGARDSATIRGYLEILNDKMVLGRRGAPGNGRNSHTNTPTTG